MTRFVIKIVAITLAGVAVLVGIGGVAFLKATGLSARPTPSVLETYLARKARRLAVPAAIRNMTNPMASNADAIAEGRDHFADHCATCHGNDGSGNTEQGRGLFPKAPNMRTVSQELSDGELFYYIEEGVRFTGMPGWSTGTQAGEDATWRLVHFIRHLPRITEDELDIMKALNPRSPAEIRQEIEAEQFLSGDDPDAAASEPHEHGGAHE